MQFAVEHITSLFENATEGFAVLKWKGFVVTDSNGTIFLANPSANRMFGYNENELLGQKIEVLVPSQYRKHHIHLRDAFYNDPKNRIMGHGRDLHGVKKNGENFPVEVSLSTYLHNEQRYVIAFIIDITGNRRNWRE